MKLLSNEGPVFHSSQIRDEKFKTSKLKKAQKMFIYVTLNVRKKKHTRQIAGKYPPLIPMSMIGIEITEDIEKKILYKIIFFKSDLF